MSTVIDNSIDDNVDAQIYDCLKLTSPQSFFLFAGAGSGKTRSLVNVLTDFKSEYGKQLRLNKQRVAIITYTNAACNEIVHRLQNDPIFSVTTIHSFAWELIKHFNQDIKAWLKINLAEEIETLKNEQSKSRDLNNKTSIDRTKKIDSKSKRLQYLDQITQFTYNPNSDNTSKDSLNHTEVISIAASFIHSKPLMQKLLTCRYPIVLIDESQDTKKELIDAFFELQKNMKASFTLGLFGDTMQRIYSDGKENLGQYLPPDWVLPVKKMNHRSNKRIITLINTIRSNVDGQKQYPRTEKEEGIVRLFICKRGVDKDKFETKVCESMSKLTNDDKWFNPDFKEVKTLILEHHMAARRMGFLEFFEPLYKEDKLKTGLLDGKLTGIGFFTNMILPIIEANQIDDQFAIAHIVKKYSKFLKRDELLKSEEQLKNISQSKTALNNLLSLWDKNNDPKLIDILQNVAKTKLFPIPENLAHIAFRTLSEQEIADSYVEASEMDEAEEELADNITNAWDLALSNPFSQIKKYNDYLSESSNFGTHQGVKGLEYPRVLVILDDEESRGFLFSYDKLFGSKELSPADKKNIAEGKETGIDRTRRLFYVACSRAKESLAIVAYSDNPVIVEQNALKYGWFTKDEIEYL